MNSNGWYKRIVLTFFYSFAQAHPRVYSNERQTPGSQDTATVLRVDGEPPRLVEQ